MQQTITNWYIFTTLTPLLTSPCYNLQKSIQLLLSNASNVSRLCQPLAHTFQGQEGTTVPRVCRNPKGEELEFGNKTIKDFCQRFLSSSFFFSFQIISIILFDYANCGWFVGSKVEALLLNKNSPLVPSPCVWARLWKHWHKPQMKPESQQSQQIFEEPLWSQDIILLFENLKR